MNGQTEQQPKALTQEEWRAVFIEELKAKGVENPESEAFEDREVSDGTSVRMDAKTGAIDPRDAIHSGAAATYIEHWRAYAAKSSKPLGAEIVQSFLRLGEAPPEPGLKDETPLAPKKTVEEWGAAKGLLPATTPKKIPGPVKASARGIAAAGNAVNHNPNYWKFAAAKAGEGWVVGAEMTEAEFDKAIKNHTDLPHGA